LVPQYETTIFTRADRELFDAFKKLLVPYLRIQSEVMALGSGKQREAKGKIHSGLEPALEKALNAIRAVVLLNKNNSDLTQQNVNQDLARSKIDILGGIAIATLLAVACGYMDGIELVTLIKQAPHLKQLPALIVSY